MNERIPGSEVGKIYDAQAAEYSAFAENSYTWRYIERPGFDRYISDFYRSDTRLLDVGCGTGRVIGHMIARGVKAKHIVGADPSSKLVAEANVKYPSVSLINADALSMPFRNGAFDLVTANMVIHHLSREELAVFLDRAYEVLKPDGVLFFVDTDPDHSSETLARLNNWMTQETPWGSKIPAFIHDMYELLLDSIYYAGFELGSGWTLPVAEEGKADMERYAHYTNRPSRLAARLFKVSAEEKKRRLADAGKTITSWTD